MAAKYYAVRKGRKPGIYRTWDACKSQVFKCEGAEYKSFTTEAEALAYMGAVNDVVKESDSYAYVDGSFNVATGVYGLVVSLCITVRSIFSAVQVMTVRWLL